MIRIVSYGRPHQVKEFICEKCRTIFTADKNDYKIWEGANEITPEYYGIHCPNCNDFLIISSRRKDLVRDVWVGAD